MLWFTSDQHFGDEDVMLAFERNFKNIEDHNNEIVEQFSSHVGRHDQVVMLGDFANARTNVAKYIARLKKITKNVRYVLGNHDHPTEMKSHFGKLVFGTKVVKHQSNGKHHVIWCSHYPHAIWPSSHHGSLHLYGHCHAARESWLDGIMPGRRSMDVGVDNAFRLTGKYRPFSINEIMDMIGSRPGHHRLDIENKYLEEQRCSTISTHT